MSFDERIDYIIGGQPDALPGTDKRRIGKHSVAKLKTGAAAGQAIELASCCAAFCIRELFAQSGFDKALIISPFQRFILSRALRIKRFLAEVDLQFYKGLLKRRIAFADNAGEQYEQK